MFTVECIFPEKNLTNRKSCAANPDCPDSAPNEAKSVSDTASIALLPRGNLAYSGNHSTPLHCYYDVC